MGIHGNQQKNGRLMARTGSLGDFRSGFSGTLTRTYRIIWAKFWNLAQHIVADPVGQIFPLFP
jgi:hypothetical protein